MVVAALAAALLLLVVWNVVGVRMLLLARRTHGTPELTLGLGLLLIAGLGYPISVLTQVESLPGPLRLSFHALGTLCTDVGVIFLYVFTWRVFRPQERWARVLIMVVIGVATLHLCGWVDAGRRVASQAQILEKGFAWACLQVALVGICFGWAGTESLLHWSMARRRLRVGLAEVTVVNRFLLWGLMGTLSAATTFVDGTLMVLFGAEAQNVLAVFTSLSGVAVSAFLWLAFFPPRGYTRWLAGRAAA